MLTDTSVTATIDMKHASNIGRYHATSCTDHPTAISTTSWSDSHTAASSLTRLVSVLLLFNKELKTHFSMPGTVRVAAKQTRTHEAWDFAEKDDANVR